MRHSMRLFGLAAVAAFAAACSDSSGPSGTALSTQEKTALSTALLGANDGGTGAGIYGAVAVQFVSVVGKLDAGSAAIVADAIDASVRGVRATSYEGAVGIQIIVDCGVDCSGTITAVVGWDGLNTQAQTVDELVMAGAFTETATPVSTGTYSMAAEVAPYGFAFYDNQNTLSSYIASTGSFALTASSFTGSVTDCSEGEITCSYRLGSMSGNFSFTGDLIAGTGAATYTQSTVSFTNLPAVRLTLSDLLN